MALYPSGQGAAGIIRRQVEPVGRDIAAVQVVINRAVAVGVDPTVKIAVADAEFQAGERSLDAEVDFQPLDLDRLAAQVENTVGV